MERLKNMSLRKSFFLLTLCGLLAAAALAGLLWAGCLAIAAQYPSGGVMIGSSGIVTLLPEPTPEQRWLLEALGIVPLGVLDGVCAASEPPCTTLVRKICVPCSKQLIQHIFS